MNKLHVENAESITIDDFLEVCRQEINVPLSEGKCRSVTAALGDVTFCRYRVSSKDLLNSSLFAASDTDQKRSRWYSSNEDVPMQDRKLITYAELMQLPNLLQDYIEMLRIERMNRPERPFPRVMTLHCATCDARWLLDGNYGFVRIIASGNDQIVIVTEMTSPKLGMRGCQCNGEKKNRGAAQQGDAADADKPQR